MIVSCSFCDSRFTVRDALVSGALVRFRCRKCGGVIPVDGRSIPASMPPSGDVVSGEVAAADAEVAPVDDESPLPIPPSSPRPAESAAVQLSFPPLVVSSTSSSPPPDAKALIATPSPSPSRRKGGVARWAGIVGVLGLALGALAVYGRRLPTAERAIGGSAPVAAAAIALPAAELAKPAPPAPVEAADESAPAPTQLAPITVEGAVPRSAAHAAAAVQVPKGRALAAERTAPTGDEGVASTQRASAVAPVLELPPLEKEAPQFDRRVASAALAAAGASAQSCNQDGTITGTRVAVTFTPNGRVTTALVEGPRFAGTPVGGCIAAKMRGARIPAFSGDTVTVHHQF